MAYVKHEESSPTTVKRLKRFFFSFSFKLFLILYFLFILHRSVDVKINYKMRVIVNETIVSNNLLDRYITKSSNDELILLQLNKDLPKFLVGTSYTNCVLNIPEL